MVPRLASFGAGVFDLDGVVTRTASVHCAAWKQLFDDYLQRRAAASGETFRPFDAEADYRRFVDGKPRYEGVRSFLASRGMTLEYGAPDDPPGRETICGLGNLKDQLFIERLAKDGVEVFDSTVELIRRLRREGVRTALVSSSKNAKAVLEAAKLHELFDVVVDGNDVDRLGLRGKPDPDAFLQATQRLGVAPGRAFVVEDALAGVAAGRAAGFGLVIGVDHGGQRDALYAQGADIVVADMAELATASEAALPDALVHYDAIAARLKDQRPVVFLDYDGTLTPIVERPELAVLDAEMRQTLRRLAQRMTVAIVSGRDRADVAQRVGIDDLIYAGSHGFDIAGPGGLEMQHDRAAEFLPALDRAEAELRAQLKTIEGVLVERKRFAIAVHYRLVDAEDVAVVDAAVDAAVAASDKALRRTGGKKVFELRPQLPWDKGKAVCWLLDALGLRRDTLLPIYIGDDETDEDAFVALRELDGLGLLVAEAPRATAAHYRLESPAAVGHFLRRLGNLAT